MKTLDEIKARLPEEFAPWVDKYGSAIIALGAAEIELWINKVIEGDIEAAYRAVLEHVPATGVLPEWDALSAEWQAANERQVEKIELSKAALTGVVRILLAIALAAVGL